MTSQEFSEWLAYDQIEPIGDVRGDVQAALICSVLAEINRDREARSAPFTPADFMIFQAEAEPEEPKTPQEIYAAFRDMALAMGAKHDGSAG